MAIRRRNGKWSIDIRYQSAEGKRKRVRLVSPVNTRKGAERFERDVRQSLLDGTFGRKEEEPTVPTLAEFSERFLQTYARANNKYSEYLTKTSILNNHLIPQFGQIPLDEINNALVDDFKLLKLKEGKSPKTIYNHLAVLHKMLAVAYDYGLIDHLPKLRWQKFSVPAIDFLDFDEAQLLLDNAQANWQQMITFALNTGLRFGELIELRGQDLLLNNGLVKVNRSSYRGHIDTPKSGKGREIPLNTKAKAALPNRKLKANELLFSEKGTPLTTTQCRYHLWKACDKAGLRRIGWHTLRHSFASHLVLRGVPLKVVQELLGHATLAMTLRYAHLTPKAKADAVGLLDGHQVGTIWAQKNGEFGNPPFLQ